MSITEVTRRNIKDELLEASISWQGRLGEVDFLSRLYNIKKLPSSDSRFETMEGDIWQHRVNNYDWDEDWVYSDPRINLLGCDDEMFLRFLCEMIHPAVQPEESKVKKLVEIFNKHLVHDGWEIIEKTRISGKPVFAPHCKIVENPLPVKLARVVVDEVDTTYIIRQITRMETSIDSDPELAIGTAKEFVETICKTILVKYGEAEINNLEFPQLVRKTREKLELLPEDMPEKAKGAETIKRLLSNLGSVAQSLVELRNLYGSGHGKESKAKGLQPRHAKLAVGAATTLAIFFFETYKEKDNS